MKALIVWSYLATSAPVCMEYDNVADAMRDFIQDQSVHYKDLGLSEPRLLTESDVTFESTQKICRERHTEAFHDFHTGEKHATWVIAVRTSNCEIGDLACWHPIEDPGTHHVIIWRSEAMCRMYTPRTCQGHPGWKCLCIPGERLVQ